MATMRWAGGTAAVRQVSTLTPGGSNIEADDVFNVILTGEDNTSQTEAVTAGGTTVAAVCDAIVAQCNASTQSLFKQVTFTDGTSVVTVSAKVAGVPFYLSETTTEAGGGSQDDQTFVAATTTANQGPNDFNTLANWVESDGTAPSAHPADNDTVLFTGGNHDLLYGLYNVDVELHSLRISRGYSGNIGQTSIPLNIDVDSNTPDGSGTVEPFLVIGGSGRRTHIKGAITNVLITKNLGDITVEQRQGETFQMVGSEVSGRVIIKGGGMTGGTKQIRQIGCSPSLYTKVEANFAGVKTARINSGYFETRSKLTQDTDGSDVLFIDGGRVCFKDSAAHPGATLMTGGELLWESDQDIGTNDTTHLDIFGGRVDLSRHTAVGNVTVRSATLFDGELDISSDQPVVLDNSTDTGAITYAGRVKTSKAHAQQSGTSGANFSSGAGGVR
jgi:hypothetical protein